MYHQLAPLTACIDFQYLQSSFDEGGGGGRGGTRNICCKPTTNPSNLDNQRRPRLLLNEYLPCLVVGWGEMKINNSFIFHDKIQHESSCPSPTYTRHHSASSKHLFEAFNLKNGLQNSTFCKINSLTILEGKSAE